MLAVFYNVLLRPLDYREPERLGLVRFSMGRLANYPGLSAGEAIDLRDAGLFESVEVQTRVAIASMGPPEDQVPVTQLRFTTGMLPMLGVTPALGRNLTEADIPPPLNLPPLAPGAPRPPPLPPVLQRMLIDYGTWQTHFGGDSRVIGRIVQIDGGRAEVVGVLPDGFRLATGREVPKRIDVYMPMRLSTFRNSWTFPTLVRLQPGTSFAEVQARMDVLSESFRRDHPALYVEQPHYRITPLLDDLTAATKPAFRAAVAAVVLLMLIAFANAAALVVARLKVRETDMAVRSALGATPAALVREVLLESALLAVAGALIAGVLAVAVIAGVGELIPRTVPRWDEIGIDWRVVGYSSILSLVGLVLFGLIPVWKVTRGATITALRGGTAQGGKGSGSASRLLLVGAQMALTTVLAFGCVQLVRSAAELSRSILDAIREMNPGRAVAETGMLTDNVEPAMATLVAVTGLLSVLSVSAGVLTAIGLYLVVAFVMHQQRRETAIRTALGATRGQVIWSTVRTTVLVLSGALPIGAALALAAAGSLTDLVYTVDARDPLSILMAVAVAATVGLLGMVIPARGAVGGNIVRILREG